MLIFNSYVELPDGIYCDIYWVWFDTYVQYIYSIYIYIYIKSFLTRGSASHDVGSFWHVEPLFGRTIPDVSGLRTTWDSLHLTMMKWFAAHNNQVAFKKNVSSNYSGLALSHQTMRPSNHAAIKPSTIWAPIGHTTIEAAGHDRCHEYNKTRNWLLV